jgi:Molybdopterin-binding domain of aldehyde dehydrogenase
MPMAEMGQGVYTAASMLLAEELEVGLDQIQVQHAPATASSMTPRLRTRIEPAQTSTLEGARRERSDVRFGSMLSKKDFKGGLRAILIQDESRMRKFDSKN